MVTPADWVLPYGYRLQELVRWQPRWSPAFMSLANLPYTNEPEHMLVQPQLWMSLAKHDNCGRSSSVLGRVQAPIAVIPSFFARQELKSRGERRRRRSMGATPATAAPTAMRTGTV